MQAGKYYAKAIPETTIWGKSAKKGTRYIEIEFEIDPDETDSAGERVKWTGYFADTTAERTIDSMRLAGCSFPGNKITDLAGLGSADVIIVVEEEMYNGRSMGFRVAWVNDPSKGGQLMDGADLDVFAAEMGPLLGIVKRNAEPKRAAADDDEPGF